MRLFSIFGNPVSHSISPRMHNLAIKGLGLNACYIRTLLQDGNQIIDIFHILGLDGANVTVPHKEYAFGLCDERIGIANTIGAVNTLVKKDNLIYGYNTDADGFYRAIASFGALESVLILGAGGTAKAIATILKEKGLHVEVLNRSQARLAYFVDKGISANTWENFKAKKFDLIVNTTAAGLTDDVLPLDKGILKTLFADAHFAFDVIYNKKTQFLKLAKEMDKESQDGSAMLLHQGVLAFDLFYDHRFDLETITTHMRQAFKL